MSLNKKNTCPSDPCSPTLFLAPMEGLGDRPFRKALSLIGGFDEACTEFLRVSPGCSGQHLAKLYHAQDTHPIPQAAQIMGCDLRLMQESALALAAKGAPRIDINCGCPSNTVNGKGAGSSLLKDPEFLHEVLKAVVSVCPVPVSAKLRSGYEDTSLFKENLQAAQESGIHFLTLHPRTKKDAYKAPANWELIAEAKQLLKIPVIASGDITSAQKAKELWQLSGCDGLMIGRSAVSNPWIFQQTRAIFNKPSTSYSQALFEEYIDQYCLFLGDVPEKTKLNKLKQMSSFLFHHEGFESLRKELLRTKSTHSRDFLNQIKQSWKKIAAHLYLEHEKAPSPH